ncbi:MAG TPA: YncE family protein [Opitutaceae bacterium]|nr:YncE family protein [Opitutaceae bacterium]
MHLLRATSLRVLMAGLAAGGTIRASPLEPAGRIPLPHVRGRIDHLALDAAGHRLFVAALGNDTVEVVDLAQNRVRQTITGFDEPQGLAFVPGVRRLFVANGGDGNVRVLAEPGWKTVATIPLGDDANNVRYDADANRVYVGYGNGGIAAIDPAGNRVIDRIPLAAHPESFQFDPRGPRLFVNVPGNRQLVVVDRTAGTVVTARKLLLAGGNFPLAFDVAGHRLYVGCRSPARLLVVSTDTSYEDANAPLHGDCDDLFFDAARHRLYASCGEGYLDVYSIAGRSDPKRIDSLATEAGARTSFFDGSRLYLAVPAHNGHGAEIRMYAAP